MWRSSVWPAVDAVVSIRRDEGSLCGVWHEAAMRFESLLLVREALGWDVQEQGGVMDASHQTEQAGEGRQNAVRRTQEKPVRH